METLLWEICYINKEKQSWNDQLTNQLMEKSNDGEEWVRRGSKKGRWQKKGDEEDEDEAKKEWCVFCYVTFPPADGGAARVEEEVEEVVSVEASPEIQSREVVCRSFFSFLSSLWMQAAQFSVVTCQSVFTYLFSHMYAGTRMFNIRY